MPHTQNQTQVDPWRGRKVVQSAEHYLLNNSFFRGGDFFEFPCRLFDRRDE